VSKICIMHLLTSFEVGGAETFAVQLGRRMDRSAYRVIACSLSGEGPMVDQFKGAGMETFSLPKLPGMRGVRLRSVLALKRLLRSERVDVLNCHNSFPRLYGTMAARLAWVPVVVSTQHAVWRDGEVERPPVLARLMNPFVTHFVAVARAVEQEGIRSGHIRRGRSSVIYNGIDLDRFAPHPGPSPGAEVVLGCVGRLVPEKGHDLVLRAVHRLRAGGAQVQLHVVGDGALRGALEARARSLGIDDSVRFFGFRSDVAQVLRSMDILVSASSNEGLPLAVIEAMASGLPVVATRVGGVPELVEDGRNGLLVPPGVSGALACAIEKLVRRPDLRAAMGSEGRRLAMAKFDLDLCARRYEELYLRLLKGRGPRAARGVPDRGHEAAGGPAGGPAPAGPKSGSTRPCPRPRGGGPSQQTARGNPDDRKGD